MTGVPQRGGREVHNIEESGATIGVEPAKAGAPIHFTTRL
jgi:hypothetical protein